MSDTAYPSVNDLTLEEKASLTSGGDAWHLQGVEAKGIPGYMITDGPHGLRKSNSATTGAVTLTDTFGKSRMATHKDGHIGAQLTTQLGQGINRKIYVPKIIQCDQCCGSI